MRKFVALVAGCLAVGGALDGVAVAVASPGERSFVPWEWRQNRVGQASPMR